MRRILATAATAALALTAVAAGEDPEFVPDPIEFTFHLHGDEATPISDDDVYATSGNQVMDTTAPSGDFQSRQLLNYVGGPNTACSDNALFPTWVGYVGKGSVVGNATLEIDVVGSTGGPIDVRIWTDTGGGCNESNVAPHAVKRTNLPVGQGRLSVELPTNGLDPQFEMKVMIVPAATSPTAQGRFLYDGADYQATLSFTCQPDPVKTEAELAGANCLPF